MATFRRSCLFEYFIYLFLLRLLLATKPLIVCCECFVAARVCQVDCLLNKFSVEQWFSIIWCLSRRDVVETRVTLCLCLAGGGVVTTRAHVHYLVTEYGIAYLFGKTLRQRAYELIKIAHPTHRESLEKASFERLKCMPCP